MSQGVIFMIVVGAMFPTVIIVAVVVKLIEVRKASRWPATKGTVINSIVQAIKKNPTDPDYDSSDTEVFNQPLVEYEYTVNGRKLRGSRITIGDKTSGYELESILDRYPVGTTVTVYYDPANPKNAVLERDLPKIVFVGVGCLLLFFIGGPLIAAAMYFHGLDWLKAHIANPDRAPFVAAAGGFASLTLLFAIGYTGAVWKTSRWPTVPGRIVGTEVEAFRDRHIDTDRITPQTLYKPSILYTYEVNGRQFTADRLTLGVVVSSTLPFIARRTARRYPPGSEVVVHYDPKNPGEAVLRPWHPLHILPWLVAVGVFWLAWAVAT
jgi:Protein of unknown function (DUF3592)